MDFSRLRLGEWIAGVAGIVLALDLFAPWYGRHFVGLVQELSRTGHASPTVNALHAFSFLGVILLLTALTAIGASVLTGTQQSVALPVAASVAVTALGVFAAVLVLYRIVNQPGSNTALDVEWGSYLGLVSCVAIAVGGYLSMADEGTGSKAPAPPARPDPQP